MTEAKLRLELERAYRAIMGFYSASVNGKLPEKTMLAYHSPTIAAAVRYVGEEALDGSQYFIGKHFTVMQDTLARVQPKKD